MRTLVFIFAMLPWQMLAQQAETIIFSEKIHDFGEISEEGGTADFEFTFVNNGGRTIKIVSVQASCGCTTPGWSQQPIPSGKSGYVKVSFDPKGRPGYFSKSLTVTTDFDSNPIILQIKGQVKTNEMEQSSANFPASNGSLRLKFNSFNVGRVYINKETQSKDFTVYNGGNKPVRFEKGIAPNHIKIQLPDAVNPGQEKQIRILYDAKLLNQYGFVTDNIQLHTDDSDQPLKSFPVYATIEEYFPPLNPGEANLAPALSMDAIAIDMGRVRQGNKLESEIIIKNTGKKELLIKAIQPNCKCMMAKVNQNKIAAGGETQLKVVLITEGRSGTQQKAVTVYSNDPKNPVQRITLTAYIEN